MKANWSGVCERPQGKALTLLEALIQITSAKDVR